MKRKKKKKNLSTGPLCSGSEFVQRDANSLEFFSHGRSTVSNTVEELIARCIMPPIDRETSPRERSRYRFCIHLRFHIPIRRLVSFPIGPTRDREITPGNVSTHSNACYRTFESDVPRLNLRTLYQSERASRAKKSTRKYNLQVQGPWTKRNVVKI